MQRPFTTASQALTNFTFIEFASGTGVVEFFGSNTEDDAVKTYTLSEKALYSSDVVTFGSGTGSGTEQVLDLDFDLVLNNAITVKGLVKGSFALITGDEADANKGTLAFVKLLVRKVTGGVESELASNTKSKVTSTVASLDSLQSVVNAEVDTPLTHFAAGDTLRLTVQVSAQSQGASGGQVGLMHDPKDRTPTSDDYDGGIDTGEFITSILKFQVPFLIDT